MKTALALTCLVAAGSAQDSTAHAPDWPTWRGSDGTAVAHASNPPVEWSEAKNVAWKVPMPGIGNSSPIAIDGRIIATTAIAVPSADEEPKRDGRHDYFVCAFELKDGSLAWQTKVHTAAPHEAGHRTGSLASNSPITDGERIYASFGSRGIHCLDLDGNLLWSKPLGTLRTRKGFGEGASPALTADHLIVNWDHEDDSFLIALDKATGEEAWRTPRDEATNWSTPIVATVDNAQQIIVAGTTASRGYEATTGTPLWSCTGLTLNTIPSPVVRDGVVYLMGGYQRGLIQAITLSEAAGDLDDGEHVLWRYRKSTSYVPSPLIYDDCVYFLRQNHGVLTCLDPTTGTPHFEGQKLEGMRHIYASPVGASDRVYLFSRGGTGMVLARSPEFKVLASNELDDVFDASPALVGDAIILRGRSSLYCIARD